MPVLTPDERRGAATVALLLCLGAGYDLWRLWRMPPLEAPHDRGVSATAGPPLPVVGPAPADARDPTAPPSAAGAVVDLNRAGPRELDGLPGIGPVLAARIVEHRERHGGFRRPEELMVVRGIGPRLYARLEGRVRVGAGTADSTAVRGRRIR